MNPFSPMHVGGAEIVGWTPARRGDQLMGSPAVAAAMHAVMGTPAFAALARGLTHSGQLASNLNASSLAVAPGVYYGSPGSGAGAPGQGNPGGFQTFVPPQNSGQPIPSPTPPATMTPIPVDAPPSGPTGWGQGQGGQGGCWPQNINSGNFGQALSNTAPWPASPPYAGGPGAAYGSQPTVVERPLTDIREFPLGFGPTSFPPLTEASVISRPQVVFRGERLVVPSTVAPYFSIIDIKVGNRSQLVNSVALPAQMFIETAVGIRLSFDTAAVAQDVALIVANGTATATTFQAAIVGTAAQ
jgi:hypothetical protein